MNRSESTKKQWRTPEYRAKLIAGQRKSWTPERKAKTRARMMGHTLSDETIQKISESNIKTYHKKHIAKKATASEIRKTLGITEKTRKKIEEICRGQE